MAIEVELKVFDGPLDLLLHLIEKNKINIFDIPIVEITDQYLAYVRKMPTEDLDVMSEFMVMAAELISIKCKMLLPPEVDEEGEEIDPRDELVQQLLEYKVYKYMSYELRDRMTEASRVFYKGDTTPDSVRKYRPEVNPEELLSDTSLKKLHEVFDSILRRQAGKIDPVRSRFGRIEKEEVHMKDRLSSIFRTAVRKKHFSFKDTLTEKPGRMMVVVTFLSVLEMVRNGVLRISQEELDGDIMLDYVEGTSLSDVQPDEEWDEPDGETGKDENSEDSEDCENNGDNENSGEEVNSQTARTAPPPAAPGLRRQNVRRIGRIP